ncbi:hypothetical protein Aasi_1748 [Candidatus Amoebophilus asiaticus 5a2]|uniref:Uncharacterized protein n=1 Tax=Amoebophilus asiaticus (strain 5a2) TaxID=452471 RepID=C3L3Y4_AMOA5|nr:hypothetical protein [Candidatus Amoebophilus asiaticus]ACP21025.1 hypothetical protein Aasi_1748 [Candidatus Amoebophilus asiaticus 5a2]
MLVYSANSCLATSKTLLAKELELIKMRAIAYSTMIDVAEREFNILIRKK